MLPGKLPQLEFLLLSQGLHQKTHQFNFSSDKIAESKNPLQAFPRLKSFAAKNAVLGGSGCAADGLAQATK